MFTVARFVTRMIEDNDCLFIGSVYKNGKSCFKPGTVYEIKEILGVLTIEEIGPSAIKVSMPEYIKTGNTLVACWGNGVDYVLGVLGKYLFFTEEEYKERCK